MSQAYATPVTLQGHTVHLAPVRLEDAGELVTAVGGDEEIWRFLPIEMPASLAAMQAIVEEMLDDRRRGTRLQFTVREVGSGKVIGTTSYCNIAEANRGLEIGWTLYARPHWRSAVNTECKYLLLRRAFEDLGCIRVQLRTDERNQRSRTAIERIGGVFEALLERTGSSRAGSTGRPPSTRCWPANGPPARRGSKRGFW